MLRSAVLKGSEIFLDQPYFGKTRKRVHLMWPVCSFKCGVSRFCLWSPRRKLDTSGLQNKTKPLSQSPGGSGVRSHKPETRDRKNGKSGAGPRFNGRGRASFTSPVTPLAAVVNKLRVKRGRRLFWNGLNTEHVFEKECGE